MLDLTENTQTLADFTDHSSEFVDQLEVTGRPLVLTVNGEAKLIVQDAESYQKLVESLEEAKTLRALAELRAGKGRLAKEFFEELGKQLGVK
jgi:PHD/YefM family antitoxin component YafN of YafNO toxin-antitoxin module